MPALSWRKTTDNEVRRRQAETCGVWLVAFSSLQAVLSMLSSVARRPLGTIGDIFAFLFDLFLILDPNKDMDGKFAGRNVMMLSFIH